MKESAQRVKGVSPRPRDIDVSPENKTWKAEMQKGGKERKKWTKIMDELMFFFLYLRSDWMTTNWSVAGGALW